MKHWYSWAAAIFFNIDSRKTKRKTNRSWDCFLGMDHDCYTFWRWVTICLSASFVCSVDNQCPEDGRTSKNERHLQFRRSEDVVNKHDQLGSKRNGGGGIRAVAKNWRFKIQDTGGKLHLNDKQQQINHFEWDTKNALSMPPFKPKKYFKENNNDSFFFVIWILFRRAKRCTPSSDIPRPILVGHNLVFKKCFSFFSPFWSVLQCFNHKRCNYVYGQPRNDVIHVSEIKTQITR